MRQLRRRIGYWLRQRQMDADLAEEVESHRAMKQQQLEQAGVPAQEAASASRRALGNVLLAREDARAVWIWPWLESAWQDLRYGARMLAKRPGFTLVVVTTLALGIGANAAIFSAVDAYVLRTLPVKDPQQLVIVEAVGEDGKTRNRFPYTSFEQFRDLNRSLSGIFAYDSTRVSVSVSGQPEMASADILSGSYFEVLGVSAALGRTFGADDDKPGEDAVAVISHSYWERRFARDPAVIGSVISIARIPFTVIGITPQRFAGRSPAGRSADLVLPMFLHERLALRDHNSFEIMGRLGAGIGMEQAAADLNLVHEQATSATRPDRIRLKPGLRGEAGLGPNDTKTMRLAAAVVGIVLLIACVNVANLLLARASGRRQEIAIRVSIGGSRARLIRQLLTESLILAALGGMLGLFVAQWGVGMLLKVLPLGGESIPFDLRTDLRALAFTSAVSLLTGIVFGLAPAFTATRVELVEVLKGEGRSESRPLRSRLLKSLVIPQLALSMVLLVGTGLLLRSLQALHAVDMGMQRDQLLTMGAYPALLGYDHDKEMRFYDDWLARMSAVPGVASAALSRSSPALFRSSPGRFNIVSPRFFSTLGVEMVRGREFTIADTSGSPRVAIINETAARKHFKGADPIGLPLPEQMSAPPFARGAQIIGVARDFKHHFRQQAAGEDLYVPHTQVPPERLGQAVLLVRAARRPAELIPEVRRQTQVIEKDLALLNPQTLNEELDGYVGGHRAIATLLGVFGSLALGLASIGLYGTMSYLVGRRTREIGIRMALGAHTGEMQWLVLRETLGVAGAGAVLGVALSLLASRVIASLLFGVAAADPPTLAITVAVMLTVTLLAGYLPARRATQVQPMTALRCD